MPGPPEDRVRSAGRYEFAVRAHLADLGVCHDHDARRMSSRFFPGRLPACAEAVQKKGREAGVISTDFISPERNAPDDARFRANPRRRPDAADRGQGAPPGPAPHDYRDGRPGERAHRGWRRVQPARIRARDVRPAGQLGQFREIRLGQLRLGQVVELDRLKQLEFRQRCSQQRPAGVVSAGKQLRVWSGDIRGVLAPASPQSPPLDLRWQKGRTAHARRESS